MNKRKRAYAWLAAPVAFALILGLAPSTVDAGPGGRGTTAHAGLRARAGAPGASAFQPAATFQEVMDSVVDPAADAVWASVSTTIDAAGVHERRPQGEADWHELRRHGIQLMEAANLIAVPGRRVADAPRTVEDGSPLELAAIQRRLDAGHAQLVSFAGAMREVARTIVTAADRRDADALLEAGGALDEACEACHKVFWYPGAPAPGGEPASSR